MNSVVKKILIISLNAALIIGCIVAMVFVLG